MFLSLEGDVDGRMDEDKERGDKERNGSRGEGTRPESRAPTPPAPTSVPVRRPFTAEDTVNLGSSTERKDDDLSLIVHVDDTLDNDTLDNDLLGTPLRNASNDADLLSLRQDARQQGEENDASNAVADSSSQQPNQPMNDSDTTLEGNAALRSDKMDGTAPVDAVHDDGENKENTATPTVSTTTASAVVAAPAPTSDAPKKKEEEAKVASETKNESSEKQKRLVCINNSRVLSTQQCSPR